MFPLGNVFTLQTDGSFSIVIIKHSCIFYQYSTNHVYETNIKAKYILDLAGTGKSRGLCCRNKIELPRQAPLFCSMFCTK